MTNLTWQETSVIIVVIGTIASIGVKLWTDLSTRHLLAPVTKSAHDNSAILVEVEHRLDELEKELKQCQERLTNRLHKRVERVEKHFEELENSVLALIDDLPNHDRKRVLGLDYESEH